MEPKNMIKKKLGYAEIAIIVATLGHKSARRCNNKHQGNMLWI
jgi:hypothetical protein